MGQYTVSTGSGRQAAGIEAGGEGRGGDSRSAGSFLALGMPFLLGSYLLVVHGAVIPAVAVHGVFVFLLLLGRGEGTAPAAASADMVDSRPRCRTRRPSVVRGTGRVRRTRCGHGRPAEPVPATAPTPAVRRFTLAPERLSGVRDIGSWLAGGPVFSALET